MFLLWASGWTYSIPLFCWLCFLTFFEKTAAFFVFYFVFFHESCTYLLFVFWGVCCRIFFPFCFLYLCKYVRDVTLTFITLSLFYPRDWRKKVRHMVSWGSGIKSLQQTIQKWVQRWNLMIIKWKTMTKWKGMYSWKVEKLLVKYSLKYVTYYKLLFK